MNTVGWTGGFAAPTVVGIASERLGLGVAIAATAAVYLLGGLLAFGAADWRKLAISQWLEACSSMIEGHRTVNSGSLSEPNQPNPATSGPDGAT